MSDIEKEPATPTPSPQRLPWHNVVTKSRHRTCYSAFGILATLSIIVGILIGWFLRVHSLSAPELAIDDGKRTISLGMQLLSVDPIGSNVVVNWFITNDSCVDPSLFLGNGDAPIATLPPDCGPVSIYFDEGLLSQGSDENKNRSNTVPMDPIFVWHPEEANNLFANSPLFRTTAALYSQHSTVNAIDSLQDYPFDRYFCEIFIFANDSNQIPVRLMKTDVSGIAVGFTAKVDNDNIEDFEDDTIEISRNSLIKAYVFIIVIGVWLITLIFLAAVFKEMFGYPQPKEVYAVPVATLFAITSLRSSMPGAPAGFGAIVDFVGILPCLAIITFTGVFLFIVLVFKNREGTASDPPLLKFRAP